MTLIEKIETLGIETELLCPFGIRLHATKKQSDLSFFRGALREKILRRYPLVLFQGFPLFDATGLLSFCEAGGHAKLLHWESGPVMEMKVDPRAKNYLFSREAVPFHWDGAFHKVPSFLVFQCIQAPTLGAGGETIFTDTNAVYETASKEEKDEWTKVILTYETEKVAHYGGKVSGALVQTHPVTGRPILRFAEPVTTKLNPVTCSVKGTSGEALINKLSTRLYSKNFCLTHQWQEGDLLIADNHTLVHGRNAFKDDCPRHLRRVQIL